MKKVQREFLGVCAGLLCSVSAQAVQVTIGNNVIDRAVKDTAATTYVSYESFGAAAIGESLSTWSIYAESFSNGLKITPLLFEFLTGTPDNTNNDFVLRGIGETITIGVADSSYLDLTFNVQEGSAAITSSNYYFGWKDGGQTTANTGVISWDVSGADFDVAALDGNSTQNVTVADIGNSLSFNNFLGSRIYSFEAKTTAVATPAPGMAMLLGLAGTFVALRRKRAG